MRRMSVVATVLAGFAAVSGVLATRAATSAEPSFAGLDYFDPIAGELILPVTRSWGGASFVGNVSTLDYTVINSKSPEYVWAPTCRPGRQTVSFTRQILSPGVPARLEGTIGILAGKPRISRVEVLVNGRRVLFSGGGEIHKRVAPSTTVLRYGRNNVTVKAVKDRSRPCQNERPGVYAVLNAAYRNDTAITASLPPKGPIGQQGLTFTFSISNKGPSHWPLPAVAGFSFKTTLESLITSPEVPHGLLVTVGGVLQTLAQEKRKNPTCFFVDGGGHVVHCTLGQIAPGKSAPVVVQFFPKAPAGDFRFAVTNTWSTAGFKDPQLKNNMGEDRRILCSPGPLPPGCKLPG